MRRWMPVLALAVATCASVGVHAQTPEQDQYRARGIERSTLSPFCPGQTLYDCPSPRAAEWRTDIEEWVGEGVSNQEIRTRLQSRVPDMDLDGDAPGPGAIFAMVGLSIVIVGLLAYRARKRATGSDANEAAEVVPVDDEDLALERRIDEELAELEELS